jgi:hypothetical protein
LVIVIQLTIIYNCATQSWQLTRDFFLLPVDIHEHAVELKINNSMFMYM